MTHWQGGCMRPSTRHQKPVSRYPLLGPRPLYIASEVLGSPGYSETLIEAATCFGVQAEEDGIRNAVAWTPSLVWLMPSSRPLGFFEIGVTC